MLSLTLCHELAEQDNMEEYSRQIESMLKEKPGYAKPMAQQIAWEGWQGWMKRSMKYLDRMQSKLIKP